MAFLAHVAGSVGPDVLNFVFEDHHRIDASVQLEQFFQVLPVIWLADIPPVFQQKIFDAFEDFYVILGGFLEFAVTHFIAAIETVKEALALMPDIKLYQNTLKILEEEVGQE